jgi:hypothetical protein
LEFFNPDISRNPVKKVIRIEAMAITAFKMIQGKTRGASGAGTRIANIYPDKTAMIY